MKTNLKIALFAFFVLTYTSTKAQLFSTTSYNAYVLMAPEKVLVDVKSLALVGFNITGPSEPSKFVKQTETSSNNRSILGYRTSSNVKTKTVTKELKDTYTIDHSTMVMNAIEGGLLKEKRGLSGKSILNVNTNIYHLVERSKLDAVAAEQKQALTGLFDESKVASLGKLAGADAITSATGTYGYNDRIEKKEVKNKDGSIKIEYYTYRKVNTNLSVKIISVETGTVLFSKIYNASKEEKVKGQKKGYDFGKKVNDLAKSCFASSVNNFLNSISPYYVNQKITVKKIKMKEFKDRTKTAQGYLKDGYYDKAYPIYKAIQEADPYNDRASYNLGTLYEVAGQYAKAKELYEAAAQFDESDKHYKSAYDRSVKGIAMVESFTKLGIEFNEYEFKEITATTLAARCKTKGNYKDRINVYQSADKKSPVIAKIPGDKEFPIKKEVNGYYLITGLLGGKEGYVSMKDAKK